MNFVKDSVFNQKFGFETDVIDFKKYFHEYASLLIPVEKCQEEKCKDLNVELCCELDDCKNDGFYISNMGISKTQLRELKERTSVDHLTCDGEIAPISHEFYKKFDEGMMKQTSPAVLKKARDSLISVDKRLEISDINKDELPRFFFKYTNYQWCATNDPQIKKKLEFKSDDYSTVLACVKVYFPFLSDKNKSLKIKLLQEIHILGDQTLAQLRDKILCSLDYVGECDVSNDFFLKNVGFNMTAKEKYPSSFIFIENTFYNDTRTPSLIDLSKELREWAQAGNLGHFDTGTMETTQICDLKLRIGHPYVFQHQGNCEHIIVFSDIRFLELGDFKLNYYPRTHCTSGMYGKHCMMCGEFYARWLVVESERLTHDKAYLCKKCFVSYNYINKQKIGEFRAYKYADAVGIL